MSEQESFDLKAALDELERLITTRVVAAEPLTVGDHVITPLCSVGFGFGSGRGSGRNKDKDDEYGSGAGIGFGGGVKPIAVIIAGPDGVRVESLVKESKGLDLEGVARALKGDKGSE
jgi:uncharacterized spore protein YtfJ